MEYTDVIKHWNSKSGKRWHCVRENESSYSYKRTCKEIVTWKKRGLSYEELCKAIDNYAGILLSYDYKWTYSWSLLQFLTRHRPDDRNNFQLERFLPGEFNHYDYMKPEARLRIHREHKTQLPQQLLPKLRSVDSVVVDVNKRRNEEMAKLGVKP